MFVYLDRFQWSIKFLYGLCRYSPAKKKMRCEKLDAKKVRFGVNRSSLAREKQQKFKLIYFVAKPALSTNVQSHIHLMYPIINSNYHFMNYIHEHEQLSFGIRK